MIDFNKKWVLITGASAGIGEAFAKRLAGDGANLILVARSKDKLEALATTLKQQHANDIRVICKDLSRIEAPQELYDEVHQGGISVDVLINNAAFGMFGDFHETDLARNQQMLMLNILAVMSLTRLFLPDMCSKKSGVVINLSSIAGIVPLPYMTNYAASKAFVLNFTEALWAEYEKHGVQFLSVCPGPTDTQFFKIMMGTDPSERELIINKRDTPENVVTKTIQALNDRKIYVVCGSLRTKINSQLKRVLTHKFLTKMAAAAMRKRP